MKERIERGGWITTFNKNGTFSLYYDNQSYLNESQVKALYKLIGKEYKQDDNGDNRPA